MTDPGTRTGAQSRSSPLSVLALVFAAGSLFATIAIGKLIEVLLKGANPDHVDVTNGLAYLGPLLIVSWSIGIVLMVITLVLIVLVHRRDGAAAARPAWIVLVVQVALVVVTLVLDASLASITG